MTSCSRAASTTSCVIVRTSLIRRIRSIWANSCCTNRKLPPVIRVCGGCPGNGLPIVLSANTTKPSNYRPPPSILSWWSTLFEIPCVAIGGITPDNAKPLVDAGADFIAVCQAVWSKDDTAAAAAAFAEVLAL